MTKTRTGDYSNSTSSRFVTDGYHMGSPNTYPVKALPKPNPITDKDTIIGFLNGSKPDYRGRYHSDMLLLDDMAMECCHDQVQYLFPLHEESQHAQTYPILTGETIAEIKSGKSHWDIYVNILKAKSRFEKFLGIGEYWDVMKQDLWLNRGNHNLLRITRIIRSLRLMGREFQSCDFYEKVLYALQYHTERDGVVHIGNTVVYWEEAFHGLVGDTLIFGVTPEKLAQYGLLGKEKEL